MQEPPFHQTHILIIRLTEICQLIGNRILRHSRFPCTWKLFYSYQHAITSLFALAFYLSYHSVLRGFKSQKCYKPMCNLQRILLLSATRNCLTFKNSEYVESRGLCWSFVKCYARFCHVVCLLHSSSHKRVISRAKVPLLGRYQMTVFLAVAGLRLWARQPFSFTNCTTVVVTSRSSCFFLYLFSSVNISPVRFVLHLQDWWSMRWKTRN